MKNALIRRTVIIIQLSSIFCFQMNPAFSSSGGCESSQTDLAPIAPKTQAGLNEAMDSLHSKLSPNHRASCPLVGRCQDLKHREKFWAQRQVDAKALRETAERLGVKPGTVKIAVIDSGFDQTGNTQMMTTPLEVKPGFDDAGNLTTDEVGHGTAVAGLIGGKDGMGISSHSSVTLYRATRSNQTDGSMNGEALQASLKRACNDGNSILNASWGDTQEEAGKRPDQILTPELVKELAGKGCFIIKAAGNSAFRDRSYANPLVLYASATESRGSEADFSSGGEISAPGADVFTLNSRSLSRENAFADALNAGFQSCLNQEGKPSNDGKFTSGTSFAAPIVAAIAGEVVGILRTSPVFSSLPGEEQIKMLTALLQASMSSGVISGARAGRFAELWISHPDPAMQDPAGFSEWLIRYPSPICLETKQIPLDSDCDTLKSLFEKNSVAAKLCPDLSKNLRQNILDLALSNQDLELATKELRALNRDLPVGSSADKSLGKYASTLWVRYLEKWNSPMTQLEGISGKSVMEPLDPEHPYDKLIEDVVEGVMDFDTACDLLPTYIAQLPQTESGKSSLQRAIKLFLNSQALPQRIYWRHGDFRAAGSKQDLERALSVIDAAYRKDPEGVGAFLNRMAMEIVESTNFKNFLSRRRSVQVDKAGELTWLFMAMLADGRFKALAGELRGHLDDFYSALNSTSSNVSIEHLKYFEPLLKEQTAAIRKKLKNALQENDLSAIGALELLWVITNKKEILGNRVREFDDLLLSTLSTSKGWGSADFVIAFKEIEAMVNSALKASPSDQYRGGNDLRSKAQKANSTDFLLALISVQTQSRHQLEATAEDESSKQSINRILNRILPAADLYDNVKRTALGLLAVYDERREGFMASSLQQPFDLFGELLADSSQLNQAGPNKLVVPQLLFDQSQDRFTLFKDAVATREVQNLTGPQILDQYLADRIRDLIQDEIKSQTKRTEIPGLLDLTYLNRSSALILLSGEVRKYLKVLPKNGKLTVALSDFRRLLERGRFHEKQDEQLLRSLNPLLELTGLLTH